MLKLWYICPSSSGCQLLCAILLASLCFTGYNNTILHFSIRYPLFLQFYWYVICEVKLEPLCYPYPALQLTVGIRTEDRRTSIAIDKEIPATNAAATNACILAIINDNTTRDTLGTREETRRATHACRGDELRSSDTTPALSVSLGSTHTTHTHGYKKPDLHAWATAAWPGHAHTRIHDLQR
jgi:hypothetical protein